MFKVLQCPDTAKLSQRSVFLGGGITGTTDWQSEIILLLEKERLRSDLTLINPRRPDFDTNDLSMERNQITWEHMYLNTCSAVLFWFPHFTLCPITLYELGKETQRKPRLYVGCDPGYKRIRDVQIQLELCRPDIKVVTSLKDLARLVADEEGRDPT